MSVAVNTLQVEKQEKAEPKLRALGRNTWALGDQILISGANFVTMVLTARGLGEGGFGKFNLIYAALLLANALQSALVTQPHNVLGSSKRGKAYARYTTTTAFGQLYLALIGAILSGAVAGVAWMHHASYTALLVALVPSIIAWQLQEFVRRVLYTEGRYAAAFFNDVVSYGGQTVAIFALYKYGTLTGPSALYALAITSALAALIGAWQIRASLARRQDPDALMENWRFGKWLAGAELLGWCSSLPMYLYLAAIILGANAAGSLKAAQTLFGPTRAISFFLGTVLPIWFARSLANSGDAAMRRQLRSVISVIVPIMGGYCLILAIFATPVLRFVYGPDYTGASRVLVLYSICAFLSYMQMVFAAALTARRLTRYIFAGSVYGGIITLAIGWLCIRLFNTEGALVGMIITTLMVTLLFWRTYQKSGAADVAGQFVSEAAVAQPTHASHAPATEVPSNNAERSTALMNVFAALDKAKYSYSVLHGYQDFPKAIPADIDCMVDRKVLRKPLAALLNSQKQNTGVEIVQWLDDRSPFVVLAPTAGQVSPPILQLHLSTAYELRNRHFYDAATIFNNQQRHGEFWVPKPHLEFACILANRMTKATLRPDHEARLCELYRLDPAQCRKEIARFLNPADTQLICSAASTGDWSAVHTNMADLRCEVMGQAAGQNPIHQLMRSVAAAFQRARRWIKPTCGLHVVFLGPDGVGKSTIVEAIQRDISPAFLQSDYQTFAPSLLGTKPKDSPHALPPRSFFQSLLKAAWWLFFYTVGYMFTVHPTRARAGLVLNHRYFVDAIVDPKRYRYAGPMWLLKVVWWLSPKPDLVILLNAPAEVVQKRKKEVPPEETARQCVAYYALVSTMKFGRIIDASQPVEKVIADVNETILTHMAQRTARRLGLPEQLPVAAPGASTVPPAMTWRYLLPSNAAYVCENAPAWFSDLLRPGDGPRVMVSWNKAPDLFALRDCKAAIVINAGRPDVAALRQAGFTYVRRFAVLPSIQAARWFIPLDNPAVSSAGFCLFTPARLSARLKRVAARLATRTRLPFWYSNQIWIAQRETPAIESKLQDLFGDVQIRLALSSGAPEPARNRKVSVAILGARGKIKAFAKFAGSPLSRELLEHEALVLTTLREKNAAQSPAPQLLFAGEVDGTFFTVQSPLSGHTTQPRLTAAHQAFLQSLQTREQKFASATDLVATLHQRIAALPIPADDLLEKLDSVMPTLNQFTVPVTIIHGDFAPWNLRDNNGAISAFDWEYGQPSGLPLLDEFHFRLQVGFLLENWSPDQAAEEFNRLARAGGYPFSPEQVHALQVVHLVEILTRLLDEGYDNKNDMIRWYRTLLARVSTMYQPTASK